MNPTIEERCKTYSNILNNIIVGLGADKIPHSDETVTYLEHNGKYHFWYNLKGQSTTIFRFDETTPLPIVVEELKVHIKVNQAKYDKGLKNG